MPIYQELLKKKEQLKWGDITKEELERLFDENIPDSMIAELYNVSKGKVKYKRDKWNINRMSTVQRQLKSMDLFKGINEESKKRLLDKENMDKMAKAITHYIFRNGPIEDMHSEDKFSQADMKKLNKYMVNKIGSILTCIYNEDWLKLELILAFNSIYGQEWDKCIPDCKDIDAMYKEFIRNGGNSAFPTTI